ncbi:MAG: stage II sporulation protein D [Clostridia bacterium]|nr:stage II sporulation protein D [Clostridia bacterium]
MKRFIMLSILLGIMMIMTPLISVRYERVEGESVQSQTSTDNNVIKVMSSDNGFIKSVDTREYLIGSVAGEMPASYHTEALKAQAVACYTYAKYISSRDAEKLGGADISDDSSVYQSYINESERKEKWGDDFDKNEKIISDAVDAVLFSYLSYDNEPAMTVYHNICSGVTESAENVWGEKVSYLVSVVSAGDKLSPDYQSKTKIALNEFKNILKKNDIEFDDLGKIERFDSGYVKTVKIGEKSISGTAFREMFSLKSADFDVETGEENVVFTCRGNGHFVGMSQYGADYMARQGASFQEILSHYYPGTELKILKN